jgi:hypothetical protein
LRGLIAPARTFKLLSSVMKNAPNDYLKSTDCLNGTGNTSVFESPAKMSKYWEGGL